MNMNMAMTSEKEEEKLFEGMDGYDEPLVIFSESEGSPEREMGGVQTVFRTSVYERHEEKSDSHRMEDGESEETNGLSVDGIKQERDAWPGPLQDDAWRQKESGLSGDVVDKGKCDPIDLSRDLQKAVGVVISQLSRERGEMVLGAERSEMQLYDEEEHKASDLLVEKDQRSCLMSAKQASRRKSGQGRKHRPAFVRTSTRQKKVLIADVGRHGKQPRVDTDQSTPDEDVSNRHRDDRFAESRAVSKMEGVGEKSSSDRKLRGSKKRQTETVRDEALLWEIEEEKDVRIARLKKLLCPVPTSDAYKWRQQRKEQAAQKRCQSKQSVKKGSSKKRQKGGYKSTGESCSADGSCQKKTETVPVTVTDPGSVPSLRTVSSCHTDETDTGCSLLASERNESGRLNLEEVDVNDPPPLESGDISSDLDIVAKRTITSPCQKTTKKYTKTGQRSLRRGRSNTEKEVETNSHTMEDILDQNDPRIARLMKMLCPLSREESKNWREKKTETQDGHVVQNELPRTKHGVRVVANNREGAVSQSNDLDTQSCDMEWRLEAKDSIKPRCGVTGEKSNVPSRLDSCLFSSETHQLASQRLCDRQKTNSVPMERGSELLQLERKQAASESDKLIDNVGAAKEMMTMGIRPADTKHATFCHQQTVAHTGRTSGRNRKSNARGTSDVHLLDDSEHSIDRKSDRNDASQPEGKQEPNDLKECPADLGRVFSGSGSEDMSRLVSKTTHNPARSPIWEWSQPCNLLKTCDGNVVERQTATLQGHYYQPCASSKEVICVSGSTQDEKQQSHRNSRMDCSDMVEDAQVSLIARNQSLSDGELSSYALNVRASVCELHEPVNRLPGRKSVKRKRSPQVVGSNKRRKISEDDDSVSAQTDRVRRDEHRRIDVATSGQTSVVQTSVSSIVWDSDELLFRDEQTRVVANQANGCSLSSSVRNKQEADQGDTTQQKGSVTLTSRFECETPVNTAMCSSSQEVSMVATGMPLPPSGEYTTFHTDSCSVSSSWTELEQSRDEGRKLKSGKKRIGNVKPARSLRSGCQSTNSNLTNVTDIMNLVTEGDTEYQGMPDSNLGGSLNATRELNQVSPSKPIQLVIPQASPTSVTDQHVLTGQKQRVKTKSQPLHHKRASQTRTQTGGQGRIKRSQPHVVKRVDCKEDRVATIVPIVCYNDEGSSQQTSASLLHNESATVHVEDVNLSGKHEQRQTRQRGGKQKSAKHGKQKDIKELEHHKLAPLSNKDIGKASTLDVQVFSDSDDDIPLTSVKRKICVGHVQQASTATQSLQSRGEHQVDVPSTDPTLKDKGMTAVRNFNQSGVNVDNAIIEKESLESVRKGKKKTVESKRKPKNEKKKKKSVKTTEVCSRSDMSRSNKDARELYLSSECFSDEVQIVSGEDEFPPKQPMRSLDLPAASNDCHQMIPKSPVKCPELGVGENEDVDQPVEAVANSTQERCVSSDNLPELVDAMESLTKESKKGTCSEVSTSLDIQIQRIIPIGGREQGHADILSAVVEDSVKRREDRDYHTRSDENSTDDLHWENTKALQETATTGDREQFHTTSESSQHSLRAHMYVDVAKCTETFSAQRLSDIVTSTDEADITTGYQGDSDDDDRISLHADDDDLIEILPVKQEESLIVTENKETEQVTMAVQVKEEPSDCPESSASDPSLLSDIHPLLSSNEVPVLPNASPSLPVVREPSPPSMPQPQNVMQESPTDKPAGSNQTADTQLPEPQTSEHVAPAGVPLQSVGYHFLVDHGFGTPQGVKLTIVEANTLFDSRFRRWLFQERVCKFGLLGHGCLKTRKGRLGNRGVCHLMHYTMEELAEKLVSHAVTEWLRVVIDYVSFRS